MGLGAAPGQSSTQSPTQVRDSLQTLTGVNRLDASAIQNLPSGGGGSGLSSWQLVTANYTAAAGDRLRVDASAGSVTITLPVSPSTSGSDIWIQRIDTVSANNVLISPGSQPIKGLGNRIGIFSAGNIGLSDAISYVDSTVGWLPQHDRITYQNLSSNLLLHFDGSNGSTTITDSSSNAIAVTAVGSSLISTTQSKFGGSSLYLPGGSGISIADTPQLELLSNDFTIELWANLSTPGMVMGKGDGVTAAGSSIVWTFALNACYFYCNGGTTTLVLPTPAPLSGQMRHLAITRQGSTLRYFIDGALTNSLTISPGDSINNITTPLQVGSYAGASSVGYIDELAIDIGLCRYTSAFSPPTTPRTL